MEDKQHPPHDHCHSVAVELCKGNREAITFCNAFYQLCHMLDDLIDTKEDGRPTMTNEEILKLWAITCLMYNSPYYIRNQRHLFPSILSVTNLYATSVAWECSPINRRRMMADVLRTCGDHVLFMVAMIEGGWEHMRAMTDKIMEEDWIRQHNADDTPN